jgi:AraC-like DNA-binding protein
VSRAHVERHCGGGLSWTLATRSSCAAVRAVAPGYIGYEERSATPIRRVQVPHPNITVIINLGAPLAVHAPALTDAGATFGSFTAGLFNTSAVTANTGDSSGIELKLTPLGAWQLLGVRMAELHNQVITLHDLLGAAAPRLEERLRNTADWDDRFDLIDALLTRQLAQRTPPSEVQWAWSRICGAPSEASVAALTTALQWSRRRLADAFREHVGMTPKTLARVVRFDRVVHAARTGAPVRWSAVAFECGYADQAHLVREFREFSGMTPTEFLRRQGGPMVGIAA